MGATMNGVLTLPTWGKLAKGSRRRRSFRQIREDGPLGQQLKRHLRTKTSRQNFVTFLAAKMIALAIIAILVKLTIVFLGDIAAAQDATPAAPAVTLSATDSAISAINTTWTLVAAFLVFCMQAGFMMLEAGFARERESVNVLL